MKAPIVVAEIGCNHMGSMEIARDLIGTAATFCKAEYVKLQKRCNRELLSAEQYDAPHPNPVNSYGDTYGAHREFLEFDLDQHRELKAYCQQMKIGYATSVWDLTSAKEIASIEPAYIKVPSGTNQNFELLGYLADHYGGQIHASVGMTTHEEEDKLVAFFEDKGRAQDLVLYSCTSGYPVAFGDVCLREITRLQNKFSKRVATIGFSGHHLGIAVDIAAQALGATWIERHYTLDRTWKGTDHAASLEPDGLRRLCRDVRAVAESLEYKPVELLRVERPQRKKLKWGVYCENRGH